MSNARQLKFVAIAKKNGATSVTMMHDHLRQQSCGGVHVMYGSNRKKGIRQSGAGARPLWARA